MVIALRHADRTLSGPVGQGQAAPSAALDVDAIFTQGRRGRLVEMPSGTQISTRKPAESRWAVGPLRRGATTRGAIFGFSAKSRRRLLRTLMGCDLSLPTLYFGTLTYHKAYGGDPDRWHLHLRRLVRQLERHFAPAAVGCLWVLEFQRRGAPHFHFLLHVSRPFDLEHFGEWLPAEWNRICEAGNPFAIERRAWVERFELRKRNGVARGVGYFIKYASKRQQKQRVDRETGEVLPTGRMWGVIGDFPREVVATYHLDGDDLVALYRRIRRWGRQSRYLSRIGKAYPGGLIVITPEGMNQLLRGLTLLDPEEDAEPRDHPPPMRTEYRGRWTVRLRREQCGAHAI